MAILANEKVLTLDYWKPASKLQVGDYVFDRNGQIVQVKLIQQYRATSCYEVEFNDYLRLSGDEHLGFPTETPKYRKRIYEYKHVQKFRRPLKRFTASVLEHLELKDSRNRLMFSVPTAKPLEFPHQDLPVPPFIFGFWFFNQRSNNKMAAPPKVQDYVLEKFRDYGYRVQLGKLMCKGANEFDTIPSVRSQLIPNVPTKIPENYLLASAQQRTELLSGILHAKSRQYNKSEDKFRITSAHYGTILQIQGLVESLGHRSKVSFDETYQYYTIYFKSRTKLIEEQVSPPIRVHQARRYITNVTQIPEQMCVHIETTAPDNTILVGEGFIATC
jgi:replicative DNA helicase